MSVEPGTPLPRRALSRLRRNKGQVNESVNSLDDLSINGDGANERSSRLRSSVDGAFHKVKHRTMRSNDGRRGSSTSESKGLTSLISRKKRGSKRDILDPERNLSVDSAQGNLSISGNRSDSSLLDDDGHSSLLTDDNSDIEGKPVRPSLSPHHSHVGYLTLSSPEINAQTVVTSSDPVADPTANIPHIVEPTQTETEPFPAITEPLAKPPRPRRSPSPAGRIREALSLPRKKVGSGDTDSVNAAASGGLGGLFRPRSRANSLSIQTASESDKLQGRPVDEGVLDPDVSVPEPEVSQVQPQLEDKSSKERPETPRQRGRSRINTSDLPATPPNQVDTPTTLVTPPTPTDSNANASTFPSRKSVTSAPTAPPPLPNRKLNSVESIRHRRAQSANIPSKLSNSIPAPLTPTAEETKTPGGTLTQPTSATGFFSTFFTTAQKATDQLSNNINNANSKSKASTPQPGEDYSREELIGGPGEVNIEKPQPAVGTLGKGDLSLSHLGISDSLETSPMTSAINLPQQQDTAPPSLSDVQHRKAEEDAAQRAVSAAYDKPIASLASQATDGRPLSMVSQDRLTLTGDQSPPRSGADGDGLKRSGSVRSRLSGGRTRKHRASSATTGTVATIAAGPQSSATGLSNLNPNGTGPRLTGFAVASSKRNKDFHQLFRSVPEDDYLIEDYSAALQRDILLHGRLYVSEGHICFSSNILGWVTNLVISFDEVVSVEKKSTAVIFPNAIVIATLQARNTFASFVARDSTYELLIGIWKISHPNLKSSLNGVTLDDAGTGDKTEVADPDGSDDDSDTGSEDEVYDEDEEDEVASLTDAGVAASAAGSDIGDTPLGRSVAAATVASAVAPQTNGVASKVSEGTENAVKEAGSSPDIPGPQSHAPTECTDSAEHYDHSLTDTTIPAPLGKVYSLMFGPASGAFMRKWLVEDQKSRELNLTDDKIGLDNDHKSMTFDYIKPLNAPVGPKQTKCITTNTLMGFDLEKAVTVDCSTQTPDVPSGNVFTTKTRYCLMWGPGNSTRMLANCNVEWTGKSWLKGPIEKGANDGQVEYVKSIVTALKAAVISKPIAKGPAKKGKRKGKKDDSAETAAMEKAAIAADQAAPNWGIFGPLHQILEAVLAIIRPFITSEVIIAVLFVLLLYSWMFPPYRSSAIGFPGLTSPERLAAYEEIWRKEESELWDWLENRVGLDHLHAPPLDLKQRETQKVLTSHMSKKLENERMGQRQMDEAIRVTEERLTSLKDAVEKNKVKKQPREHS